jgi:hypothetical protein
VTDISQLPSMDFATRLSLRRIVLLLSDPQRYPITERWEKAKEAFRCAVHVRRKLLYITKARLVAVNYEVLGFYQAHTDFLTVHRSLLAMFLSIAMYVSGFGKPGDLAHNSVVCILNRLEEPRFILYDEPWSKSPPSAMPVTPPNQKSLAQTK